MLSGKRPRVRFPDVCWGQLFNPGGGLGAGFVDGAVAVVVGGVAAGFGMVDAVVGAADAERSADAVVVVAQVGVAVAVAAVVAARGLVDEAVAVVVELVADQLDGAAGAAFVDDPVAVIVGAVAQLGNDLVGGAVAVVVDVVAAHLLEGVAGVGTGDAEQRARAGVIRAQIGVRPVAALGAGGLLVDHAVAVVVDPVAEHLERFVGVVAAPGAADHALVARVSVIAVAREPDVEA